MPARLRPYEPADLDALYDICLQTGAAGRDATGMVRDPKLFGHLFAAPYGVLEPEHARILDDGAGSAVGYIVAAIDSRAFEARCDADWWPALREAHPLPEDPKGLDDLLISLLHDPPTAEEAVLGEFPSHLHIDLLPSHQGGGWGRTMMEAMFELLAGDGSPGVHLGVSARNPKALAFYRHLGLDELGDDGATHTMAWRL